MSDREKIEIAKRYVDKQLETMKQYGSAPKSMSKGEYDSLVRKIAATVKTK